MWWACLFWPFLGYSWAYVTPVVDLGLNMSEWQGLEWQRMVKGWVMDRWDKLNWKMAIGHILLKSPYKLKHRWIKWHLPSGFGVVSMMCSSFMLEKYCRYKSPPWVQLQVFFGYSKLDSKDGRGNRCSKWLGDTTNLFINKDHDIMC